MKKLLNNYILLLPLFMTTLSLSACSTTSNTTNTTNKPPNYHSNKPLKNITEIRWQLTRLNKKPIITKNTQDAIHMTLTTEQIVHGFSGCNQFSGRYQSAGNQLAFSEIISTMMACFDAPAEEYLVFQALEKTHSYKVSGRELSLLDSKQKTLAIFEASSLH